MGPLDIASTTGLRIGSSRIKFHCLGSVGNSGGFAGIIYTKHVTGPSMHGSLQLVAINVSVNISITVNSGVSWGDFLF